MKFYWSRVVGGIALGVSVTRRPVLVSFALVFWELTIAFGPHTTVELGEVSQ